MLTVLKVTVSKVTAIVLLLVVIKEANKNTEF